MRDATRLSPAFVLTVLAVALTLVTLVALCVGAYRIAPLQLWRAVFAPDDTLRVARAVALEIRLPRVILGIAQGCGLAAAGAAMQAIFRNPLADPGLIGVSSGAALGAGVSIVLLPALGWASLPTLPFAAFAGALLVVMLVYRLGIGAQGVMLQWLLLAGIAINSIVMALLGILSYIASDAQLRSLTFWSLGSLGQADWATLRVALPVAALGTLVLLLHVRALTAFQLGEADAAWLGVSVATVKRRVLVAVALSIGALVSVAGVIGFVGLVAPHCVRLMCGPDQRVVLPGAMLLGAILTVCADLAARTIAAPADIPLGILTALLGAPFFLMLLVKSRRSMAGLQ